MDLSMEDLEGGKCGLLKTMYGTRDAAQYWEIECTEMMVDAGFRQGSYSACVFYHGQKNFRAIVQGDDFERVRVCIGFAASFNSLWR